MFDESGSMTSNRSTLAKALELAHQVHIDKKDQSTLWGVGSILSQGQKQYSQLDIDSTLITVDLQHDFWPVHAVENDPVKPALERIDGGLGRIFV